MGCWGPKKSGYCDAYNCSSNCDGKCIKELTRELESERMWNMMISSRYDDDEPNDTMWVYKYY